MISYVRIIMLPELVRFSNRSLKIKRGKMENKAGLLLTTSSGYRDGPRVRSL